MHNQRELNLACFHDTVLAPAQYPQTASIPATIFYAIHEFSYFTGVVPEILREVRCEQVR